MDKIEEIVSTAHVVAAVFGNEEKSDYAVAAFPLSDALGAEMAGRGRSFLGVVGLRGMQPCSAFTVPLTNDAVSAVARLFIRFIEEAFTAIEFQHDSAAWLSGLHALEDPR